MVESSVLAGQLLSPTLQQAPQSLPSADVKDAERFQDLISGNGSSDTSIQPQSLENSVLQMVEPGQSADSGSLVDKMINQASKIDGNYHSLLDQLGNRQSFDSYLSKQRDVTTDNMVTYPAVNNAEASESNPIDAALERMQDSQQASLSYSEDVNSWAMQFRMWTSGVELVSAAAQKVSTAFQTLFRASG